MVIQILLIHLVIIFRGMWILDMLKYHYFGFRLDFENMYASFFKYLIHSEWNLHKLNGKWISKPAYLRVTSI